MRSSTALGSSSATMMRSTDPTIRSCSVGWPSSPASRSASVYSPSCGVSASRVAGCAATRPGCPSSGRRWRPSPCRSPRPDARGETRPAPMHDAGRDPAAVIARKLHVQAAATGILSSNVQAWIARVLKRRQRAIPADGRVGGKSEMGGGGRLVDERYHGPARGEGIARPDDRCKHGKHRHAGNPYLLKSRHTRLSCSSMSQNPHPSPYKHRRPATSSTHCAIRCSLQADITARRVARV